MRLLRRVPRRWGLIVVAGLATVVLLGVLAGPAQAPTAVEYASPPIGMTNAQTARLSVANPTGKAVTVNAVLLDGKGASFTQFELIVGPNGIAFIDINGDGFGLADGKRLQFRAIVTAPMPSTSLHVSLELFDTSSGRTDLVVIALVPRLPSTV